MRQIAKRFGSVQGEILEIRQLCEILAFIGFESEIIDCSDNKALYARTIKESLDAKIPPIVFFGASYLLRGCPMPYCEKYGRSNEHAVLLTGYNEAADMVTLVDDGVECSVDLEKLYSSSSSLPQQRNREQYKSIKDKNPSQKYDLVPDNEQCEDVLRSSIFPEKNSGFSAKIIRILPPTAEKIIECRNQNNIPFSSRPIVNNEEQIHDIEEKNSPVYSQESSVSWGLSSLGLFAITISVASIGFTVYQRTRRM